MVDIAIIGGGIIGTAIAREFSKYALDVVLLEKDYDVSNGTTKANSAIVHAGYDALPGTLMAKFNALGNPMFDELCRDLCVPLRRIGSIVVAFEAENVKVIEELYKRGLENGIPGLELLNGDEVREREPNASAEIKAGLYAKTAGIVGPFELAIALAENAVANGVEIKLNSKVTGIVKKEYGFDIEINGKDTVQTRYIVNAAGVYSGEINALVSQEKFEIIPIKGEYYILDKSVGNLTKHVMFQCPSSVGKGVLVAPTVHGNIIVGPDAETLDNREDVSTRKDNLDFIWRRASMTFPHMPMGKVITNFAGLRAESTTHDFVIGFAKDVPQFYNVAGIKSPGLTAAPAIAKHVVEEITHDIGKVGKNIKFFPKRDWVEFAHVDNMKKAELIKENKLYGNIICRCEMITEAEIVKAIHSVPGATTLDGIKRRVRPGMGRCQGGFCGPRIVEILARELNISENDVRKSDDHSYIISGDTKQ